MAIRVGSFALAWAFVSHGPLPAQTWQADFDVALPEGDAVTNLPGTFSGPSLAGIVGADRFHAAGYTGQGTISAVVEAGHVWGGHESLGHVVDFQSSGAAGEDDRHATWVGMLLGGRRGGAVPGVYQEGLAYGTDLRSGAIATQWNGAAYALSFGVSGTSLLGGYEPYFGNANVINSSWGGGGTDGSDIIATYIDAKAFQNRNTASVVSAGNNGPGTNTVGSPGSGYNSISVAALQNDGSNNYDTVASFSSRGPNDHQDPVNGVVPGVRAGVDIAAPGTNLTSAFYGGQTGGNGAALTGSTDTPGNNLYSGGINGTSFAAPLVSAGVSLMHSASLGEGLGQESRDTLVVKSVLQNSARKTTGWDNGQATVDGVIRTNQSLDYLAGAGAMDLDRAFDEYVGAGITQDVAGQLSGSQSMVEAIGWDLGAVNQGEFATYMVGTLEAYSDLNVTLNWYRERGVTPGTLATVDISMANLTLQVLDLSNGETLIAESESLYNLTEHLSFMIPTAAEYAIRVLHEGNIFGSTNSVDYGLAWSGVAALPIPEPTAVLLGVMGVGSFILRRRRSRL
jgi:hypothetical protein